MKNQVQYKNDWQRENCDRIALLVPKGKKEVIKKYAKAKGKSMNSYVMSAVDEKMARDDKEGSQSHD